MDSSPVVSMNDGIAVGALPASPRQGTDTHGAHDAEVIGATAARRRTGSRSFDADKVAWLLAAIVPPFVRILAARWSRTRCGQPGAIFATATARIACAEHLGPVCPLRWYGKRGV